MKTNSNICCIFNYSPHYRSNIYKLMDNEWECDFYFGDIESGKIRKLDFNRFRHATELKTIQLFGGKANWISGSVRLVFKPYKRYILTGEPNCFSTWAILILCRLLGKKTFLWTHGWYGKESPLKIGIKKIFFRLASSLLLYGEYAKSQMIKVGFNEDKMNVVYNSLDYDEQAQVRSRLKETSIYKDHFQNSNPVMIFTGRLTKIKKLDLIIQAHQKLIDQKIYFNVIILGDGPEKKSLEDLVEKAGLSDRYWFYGECYDEEKIGEFYYNAAACISPGNVGLTSIHSLMYGCPVISHSDFPRQMPEFEAIKTGETGSFFSYDDSISLTETIKDWLKAHSKKQKSLINNCFKVVDEKFNPNYQLSVLRNVLSPSNSVTNATEPKIKNGSKNKE